MATISWNNPGKSKWTLKEALEVSPMRLAVMNTEKRAELAQFLRNQFKSRMSQFTRAGEISPALSTLSYDFTELNKKLGMDLDPFENVVTGNRKLHKLAGDFATRSNPQNALAAYITVMQNFFASKTSTLKGWRDYKQEQDYRLFGHIEKEKSKYVRGRQYYRNKKVLDYEMTDAERVVFWKVYRDLKKSGWTEINSYDSDIQRKFGSVWRTGKFNKEDIEEAYAKMLEVFDNRPESMRENAPGTSGDPTQPDHVSGEVDVIEGDYFDEE